MLWCEECSRFINAAYGFEASTYFLCSHSRSSLRCNFSDKSATLFRPCRKGVFLLHNEKDKAAWAAAQLIQKASELGRLPQKADFDDTTRSRIKAFLGPWPRALEKAGLKEKNH